MSDAVILSVRSYLTIEIRAYEFPSTSNTWDGNWLAAAFRVKDTTSSTTWSGPYIRTDELSGLRKALKIALDGSGDRASLDPIESWYDIEFERVDNLGHFELKVSYDSVGVSGDNPHSNHVYWFRIDQTDILSLVRQLENVLERFPVVGQ